MAREAPNSATCSFFICIKEQPELDYNGARNPDGFGFAAFGNNYLDYRSSKQYRNAFSLAGLRYDANETIISKSYFKTMGELSLPPIRFRKLGTYSFYVN